jgi:chorismate--pyruvate lyase
VVEYRGRPESDETAACRLRVKQHAVIREVYLFCDEVPVVFAHSVLPAHSLKGAWRALHGLGSRPLGAALFADPRVRRSPLSFRKLPARHALALRAVAGPGLAPGPLWARRSGFFLNRRVILVTEVFLPAIGALPR